MKNNMARVVSFFLVGVLLCGCLVGCSSKGATDTKQQVSAKSSEEEVKDKKEESQKPSKALVSDKQNTDQVIGKTPISNKKVTFNKDKLYKRMVSSYQEPDYIKEPTRNEFLRETHGQIPDQTKRIFEWYFNIIDTGKSATMTVTNEEHRLFEETVEKRVLNYTVYYETETDGQGTYILSTEAAQAQQYFNDAYSDYCRRVKEANTPKKQEYDSYIAKTKQACDMVEKAVNAAHIKDKDEVTAINSIIDYICKNCTYWNEAVGMPMEQHNGEWIADCLGDHHAVCNGYAKTFYAMCYYAGIDVSYYWGYTDDGGAHAWDSVKIGGEDYYFDITWQDAIIESGSSKDTYMWAGNAEFSKEHIKKGTDITFW